MKNILLIIGFIASSYIVYGQQVPLYTQYNVNPYTINAAYAGAGQYEQDVRVVYRNQWSGINDAPKTGAVTYNGSYGRTGLGLMAFSDNIGNYKTTGASISYAYHIPLNETYKLSIGLGAQMLRANLDVSMSTLEGIDQTDEAIINAMDGESRFDASPGMYLYSDKLYVGLSAPSLIQTRLGNTTSSDGLGYISRHFFGLAGYRMDVGEEGRTVFEPSILVRKVAAAPFETDLNAKLWLENTIMLGLTYRTSEQAFAAMFGVNFKGFIFTFSNDFSFGDLNATSQEITVGYRFNKKETVQTGFEGF